MKTIALSLASLAATVAAFFALAGTAAAGDGKTTICHYTGSQTNPVVIITVSNNAVAQHLAHGDDLYVNGHCGDPTPPPL